LFELLLSEINEQLSKKGLLIKHCEVSIIDASVIKAKQNRPNKDKDGNNTQGKEAGYKVKKGYDYTAGNVHDSKVFENILTGAECEVYADSAAAIV